MRVPNSEQKRAIECNGNVLLSAGAGSGKTYVLVEHIIFLAQRFIDQKNYSGEEDFFHKIKKYFSGIVLITFTRKSTAEIRLRMKKRMELKTQEGKVNSLWKSVLAASPLLNISTIHGFCSLLLKQGYFPGFGRSFDIMSEVERHKRIDQLFVEWFEMEKVKKSFRREERNYEAVVANRHSIVNGLVKIFNDPMLRNEWREFGFETAKSQGLSSFMEEYLACTGLDKIFSEKFFINFDKKPKQWQINLKNFYALAEQYKIGTVEGIEAFWGLLTTKRIVIPKVTEENIAARERIKDIRELKEFLKEHKKDLIAFEKHQDEMIQWTRFLGSAFDYVDNRYGQNLKMSYSDLEYYVFRGLGNQEIVDKVSNAYRYIVIDEFQDTSYMQFEIIKKIVKGNYGKIFCVGDYKQAIYGFRGGEISVFEKCMKEVKNNLELACNYRSGKNIVSFNNKFFDALLDGGENFKKIDIEKSKKKFQYSGKKNDLGGVFRHNVIVSEKKVNVERVEAKKIFDLINGMRKSGDASEVAVLYKKLAPSRFLREYLLLNKIPFTAQIKVSYGEDFLTSLCMILLEFHLSYKERKRSLEKLIDYPRFMILAYFGRMGLTEPKRLPYRLERFLTCVHLYGFESAFYEFIYGLGISSSNYSQNVKVIKDLCDMFGEDLESIYNSLKKNSDQKYSLDVHFGEKKGSQLRVVIMTVHSSKGLEFEHVILGGINGLGRDGRANNYIGKHPGAIKWKASSEQKKPFLSPQFILEKYISSQKDFAESRRLFYVACTRAVKGLHWVDVLANEKKKTDKSWVTALRKWCDLKFHEGINVKEDIWQEGDGKERPTLISDAWGIIENKSKNSSMILPEISVSGFVSIAQCPRKFYLQNVCRFEKDSKHFSVNKKIIDNGNKGVSSAARGTVIHKKISDMIEKNWVGLSQVKNKREQEIFRWVKKLLAEFYARGLKIFSEIPVKFSFFGQVISGAADLVIFDRDRKALEIWDFKTGRRDESYWFQLFCYAYGFAHKYALEGHQSINMVIVYIDKRDIVRKTRSLGQIKRVIEREWTKLDCLEQVNLAHCPSCCYQNLCRPDNILPRSDKY